MFGSNSDDRLSKLRISLEILHISWIKSRQPVKLFV
jgi:hypothetical protein